MNNTLYTKLSTTVSTCRHGKCIVATNLIRAGSLIFTLDGVEVKEPSKYTLQIAAKRHLNPLQSRWRFANHNCAPNAGIDLGQRAMVALRDIDPGAEVTFKAHPGFRGGERAMTARLVWSRNFAMVAAPVDRIDADSPLIRCRCGCPGVDEPRLSH